MKGEQYDYFIVGQGIAGTTLAWHLLDAGKRVLVINDSTLPSSSKVAAGIFNPLTGRKLVKTWMADTIFPYARDFYGRLEERLNARFVHPLSIYRPYRSVEEQNNYLSFTSEPDVSKYIVEENRSQLDIKGLIHPLGGLEVTGSGWVDLVTFLEKSRTYFIEKGQYVESHFNLNDLVINNDDILWKGLNAEKIIFCQGVEARENSLFDWLAFNPAKGQILDVTFDDYSANGIVNQGVFVLPLPDGKRYRVGATYSWHDLDWEISEDGKQYLEGKLQPMLKGSYSIQEQRAGIRPACKDRRPLVGIHPHYKTIGVFNGLGSKGVTLAPYFANEFVEHLEHGKELNPSVNIDRYFSLYYH